MASEALMMLPAVGVAVVSVGAALWLKLVSVGFIAGLVFLAGIGAAACAVGQRAVKFLGKDEQLLVEGFTGTMVLNGPGMQVLNPFSYRSAEVRKAVTLSATAYAKIVETVDGSERVEKGPQLFFLGPYEKVLQGADAVSLSNTAYVLVTDKLTGERTIIKGPTLWFPSPHDSFTTGEAVVLSSTDSIFVEDLLTGDKRTVKGPQVWFPEPHERADGVKKAVALEENQYIRLKDTASGSRWIQRGKALIFFEPTWTVEGSSANNKTGVMKAWSLKAYEYVRLVDRVTGKIAVHRGEKTVFPGPDDELLDGDVLTAIDLKVSEYVKIMDQASGEIRVEKGSKNGSQLVFLGPNEKVVDGNVQKAISVDDDHAVMVRDKATGQLRLVTERQLFVPGANETIESVQQRIRLADHEAMIIKDHKGDFKYFYGSDEKRAAGQPRSFFLQPYEEVVKLCWSKGRRCDSRSLVIERFDCRPQFMPVEFNCRTSDNVELILEATFFWEVVDLPAMVKRTGDTSGDLCNHARSQFIQQVAKVTLKEFMDSSHQIATQIYEQDSTFYESRGVKIHSLGVTSYSCAERRTAEILDQIIQETTSRMNRLSQAESENEVNLFRMQGHIVQEKLNGDLLKIQHQHSKEESEIKGRSEAMRIAAFMDGLKSSVTKTEDRADMWQVLRKIEAFDEVSKSNSTLYFTPKDVDLSIETRAR